MSGPNSAPNGDTRLVMGHVNEEFMCQTHGNKHLDRCEKNLVYTIDERLDGKKCVVVGLRTYLAQRNKLVTGKTKS